MVEAAVVQQVFGDFQVAVEDEEAGHPLVDGLFAADLAGDGFPHRVDLEQAGVERAVAVEGVGDVAMPVPCDVLGFDPASGFPPCQIAERVDRLESVGAERGLELWAPFRRVLGDEPARLVLFRLRTTAQGVFPVIRSL